MFSNDRNLLTAEVLGTGDADRSDAQARRKAALCIAACLLLSTVIAAMGCVGNAYAADSVTIHVSYQWYRADPETIEDFEVFDTEARISGNQLVANVMPEAYAMDGGCSWRVMKNFAGGVPAGEENVTREASYDEETGVLAVPASRAGENLTIVFVMPWDHESHAEHGHFRTSALRRALVETEGLLSAASANSDNLVAGAVYPLAISSGASGLESSPSIYAADTDISGGATMAGYPELEGEYRFYVTFDPWNCELFGLAGDVPGRQGNGGTVYGSSGTAYDYSWGADYKWCVANCVENVYNTGGMPVPLNGEGSWVRIDSVSGNVLNCTFRIECNNPDGTNAQDIMGSFELALPKGAIALMKTSANAAISGDNRCYTLEGAEYGVFDTEEKARTHDAGNALATYATGEDGAWTTGLDYNAGTYYIAETAAPTGFALSDVITPVDVAAAETTSVAVVDEPLAMSEGIRVQKRDSTTGASAPQGDASLEGAEITFCYYDGHYDANALPDRPTRTWVMKTDAQGMASPLDGETMKASGDALFLDASGSPVVPLGTLTAIESKAPDGYLLGNPQLHVMRIAWNPLTNTVEASGLNYSSGNASNTATPLVAEDVKRGNIALVKADAETGKRTPQGGASLAGAQYDVINRSASSVTSPQTGEQIEPGSVVCTITTDETGYAATDAANANGWSIPASYGGKALAYGTYEVVEREPATGYLVNESFAATVNMRSDGQVSRIQTVDYVARGRLVVGKASRENGMYLEQGAASLEGWTFEVVNKSGHPVLVDGAEYASGTVVKTIVTATVDGRYIADTGEGALPFGTYEVHEISTMRPQDCGYLFDDESQAWSQTFSINSDGHVADLVGESDACKNQVVRGDLTFVKAESPSMTRLAGVPFKVTSQTTGEWHVLVTDGNGYASTESDNAYHTYMTNANDAAIGPDGSVDASKLNDEAGIWFSGSADVGAPADDAKGALPFDTYLIEELPVQANRGLNLVRFETTVSRDGRVIDVGTLSDVKGVQPQVSTSLRDGDEGKLVAARQGATLVDTVTYNNLDTTVTYTLTGSVHLVDGGQAGECITEAQLTFTPATTHGTVQLEFTGLDTSALTGASLVCFERLYDESGREVASHADPEDTGQTVGVPGIGTELVDTATGGHVATSETADAFELTDTVSFVGLVPNKTYGLTGSLHDKATGNPLLDASGSPITASTSFTPESADGTVGLTFSFSNGDLAGTEVVAFESLTYRSVEYAVHADLEDEAQTVRIPKIGTSLTDKATGHHVMPCSGPITLEDHVSYENLEPGRLYTAQATLLDKETGLPIRMADGTDVEANVEFVPDSPSGTVRVEFAVDAANLSHATVCFERVMDASGRISAVHEDLNDANQTVTKPTIATTLVDALSGTHTASIEEAGALVDTIAYEGLQPGQAYEVHGTLRYKDTGEPVLNPEGNETTVSVPFTPAQGTGSVEVPFEFDLTSIAGRAIVAFESVSADGREYASHADLDDEGQTVYIPAIGTTLIDPDTHDHVASSLGKLIVVDTVTFDAFEPGRSYTVEGTLVDKRSGEALTHGGAPVMASATFTPQAESGTVDVAFSLDAADIGGSYVAFERVIDQEGRVVASHADLDDARQTVYLPRISTTAFDSANGKREASAASGVTVVDEVTYEGLEPGRTYLVRGKLVDKASGTAVKLASPAERTFTPDEENGTERMELAVEQAVNGGTSLVAFETLYLLNDQGAETPLASHEDIDDAAQTVTYHAPQIGDLFDKTGYWLLQNRVGAALAAACLATCGILSRGRRKSWRALPKRHGMHARRR